uniref:Uncharacterized protein n=1 Tax=Poecilia mexicana TaxID=48701 RepID=A0A3B3X4F2_9TELE
MMATMGTPSTDRKGQLDYGVQIRFIKDLHDTGGVPPEKSRANGNATPPSNKYGVAVRVQGISGQPYVVLKDGEKGDSYGVQETEKKLNGTDNEEYNEAGLKPVKLKSAGPKGFNRTAAGFTGSVGRKPGSDSPPKPIPEPPPPTESEPAAAIDTNSLAPINKLINKFNSSTPGGTLRARGRTGARQRLQFDERKRSRSLDARKDAEPQAIPASPSSPSLNPHAAPISAASSPEMLSRSLSQNTEVSRREEAQVKQSVYNVFKAGLVKIQTQSKIISAPQFSGRSSLCFLSSPSESEDLFKRKSSLVFETPDRLQVKSRFVVPENILQTLRLFMYVCNCCFVFDENKNSYIQTTSFVFWGKKKKCDCLRHHDVKNVNQIEAFQVCPN